MKKLNTKLLLLLIIVSISGFAQENRNFPRVEEMHNQKWKFLVEKVQLSAKDADAVQPIFMDYEKSVWTFHAKNMEYFKLVKSTQDNVSFNFAELNERYVEMEMTQAQMFKNYHLKLKKILSPETLFKYYKAEREFKHKLLQNFPNKMHQGKKVENNESN